MVKDGSVTLQSLLLEEVGISSYIILYYLENVDK